LAFSWERSKLHPSIALAIAHMAEFHHFLVSKLLGCIQSWSKKTDNGRGRVIRFSDIQTNMATISVLADYGFGARFVDSFERRHETRSGANERREFSQMGIKP
jgi:hypothetical protein